MRELLLNPTVRSDLIGVRREEPPPEKPLTNPMSDAGPRGWIPAALGRRLAQGATDQPSVLVVHRMSGVNGLFDNVPPGATMVIAHAGHAMPGSRTKNIGSAANCEKGDAVGA